MIKKMISQSNRRRLVRFSLIRKQLCPICGNILLSNSDNVYLCKNLECGYKDCKECIMDTDDEINIIENNIKSSL